MTNKQARNIAKAIMSDPLQTNLYGLSYPEIEKIYEDHVKNILS